MPEFESLARFGVALIGTLAFAAFVIRINDDWRGMSRGWKVVRCSMLLLVVVCVIGTVEVMLINPPVPLGSRNALLPIALAGLLVGLWMVRKDHSPMTGGWIKASELREILEDVEHDEVHDGDPCNNARCEKARLKLWAKIDRASHREHTTPEQ